MGDQVMLVPAMAGVPADGQGLGGQAERHGPLRGTGGTGRVRAWPTPKICFASKITASMDHRAAYRSTSAATEAVMSVETSA
ncbi:hypothetical protein [Microbispora amethystogenes]|uniref:hypothetical protein n=1 Tax=Microbispora amethystogenes TaxID=1427754 RepID=UPI0019536954|nr:hypothetical protein [Microbispora amethystogenes]